MTGQPAPIAAMRARARRRRRRPLTAAWRSPGRCCSAPPCCVAVVVGPWLARAAVRLAARDDAARPGRGRVTVADDGAVRRAARRRRAAHRPPAGHRRAGLGRRRRRRPRRGRPGRATGCPTGSPIPACAVCAAALLVDAAVLGTWGALLRALAGGRRGLRRGGAGAAGLARRRSVSATSSCSGCSACVLGWFGWGVLLAGVFLGLLTGRARSRWSCWPPAGPAGAPRCRSARRCWPAPCCALALGARPPRLSGSDGGAGRPGRIGAHVALADRR